MPFTTIKTLVKAMGFCCIFAFVRSVRGNSHPRVAARLGVDRWTVYYWRRKVKERTCRCDYSGKCALKRFGEIPRVTLTSLREGCRDPFV